MALANTSHLTRQRIDGELADDMVPLRAYTKTNGQHFTQCEKKLTIRERRQRGLPRLNSAPELHHSGGELPPIRRSEKSRRPLTPVATFRRSSLSSSKSLPNNYRINLDLTPLIEVGTCCIGLPNTPLERKRITSLGSDFAQSSESFPSSGSPKLLSLSSSSRAEHIVAGQASPSRSTSSTDSCDVIQDDSPVEDKGKDGMILRWLQTVKKSTSEATSGDLLPSIKEGRPT